MEDSKELIKIKEEPEDWELFDAKVDVNAEVKEEVKIEACDPPSDPNHSENNRLENRLESLVDVKEEDSPGPDNPVDQIAGKIQESKIDQSLGRPKRKSSIKKLAVAALDWMMRRIRSLIIIAKRSKNSKDNNKFHQNQEPRKTDH